MRREYTLRQMWAYGRNIMETMVRNLNDNPHMTKEEFANYIQLDIDRFDSEIGLIDAEAILNEADAPPTT